MKLTDAFLKSLKPLEKQKDYSDGGGLNLRVKVNGTKQWLYRYRRPHTGLSNSISIGLYPQISLKQARSERQALRDQLDKGIDPSQDRQEKRLMQGISAANSFEVVARQWFEVWRHNKSESTVQKAIRRMETDLFPHLGSKPINDITAQFVFMVIRKIEARGALDLAERVYQRCGQIFKYGFMNGLCEKNPLAGITPSDFLKPRARANQARVDAKELPQLLRKIDDYQGSELTRLAIQLMSHVFIRTTELINAKWSEIDLEAKEWRIPAERMKMRDPHIIGLSTQVVAILKRLKEITGGREFVFPSATKPRQSMSNNTILGALKRMGYKGKMTGHGFRGVASTILHEQGYPHEHIEIQLAHAPRNQVSASYNHAKYLSQRARMMQDWSNYLDAVKQGGKVIPILRKS
jgi:integrase